MLKASRPNITLTHPPAFLLCQFCLAPSVSFKLPPYTKIICRCHFSFIMSTSCHVNACYVPRRRNIDRTEWSEWWPWGNGHMSWEAYVLTQACQHGKQLTSASNKQTQDKCLETTVSRQCEWSIRLFPGDNLLGANSYEEMIQEWE